MQKVGLAIAIVWLTACSSSPPPPLLAPGATCRVFGPCNAASTDRCFDGCRNTCWCQTNGMLNCTLLLCDTGPTPDAGP